jgi:hypothetical protein
VDEGLGSRVPKGPSQCLAIHRDHLSLGRLDQGGYPVSEGILKGTGVDAGEDPSEGVVRRDARFQFEKLCEERLLRLTESLHRCERIRPAQHSVDGDDEDVDEWVLPRPRLARVRNGREMRSRAIQDLESADGL